MQARSATGATAAATQSQPEPQDMPLLGGARLPLMGFGTYKVESSAAVTCALRPLSALWPPCIVSLAPHLALKQFAVPNRLMHP